jgi:fumarate hydratase class II
MRMTATRIETDSLGSIEVPADRLWGAQTERSRRNFIIGGEPMPLPVIHALARVKKAAAGANVAFGLLEPAIGGAIAAAADEIAAGHLDGHFPLVVWQTGSGTQSNMNVNEVIANHANIALGGKAGDKAPVHPNDHVNRSQSSNDVFPTAMHVATVLETNGRLLPALRDLAGELERKTSEFAGIVKIGRTHLQDATPLTLGQEFSGWTAALRLGIGRIEQALDGVHALAQGGTAVGTGLNAPEGFAAVVTERLAEATGAPFRPARNAFEALASHGALAAFHGSLAVLAADLFKIASDIRLLGSGPRAGLGELRLPENEPGSSIMPGKVNPTQAEAMTMVCAEISGNNAAVLFAASQGHLQLNVFKPVIAFNVLRSVRLLADAARSFTELCVAGIEPDRERIADSVSRSLMLVTALVPAIGYDRAAKIARTAQARGTTLREEALVTGWIDGATFDRLVDPFAMTHSAKNSER